MATSSIWETVHHVSAVLANFPFNQRHAIEQAVEIFIVNNTPQLKYSNSVVIFYIVNGLVFFSGSEVRLNTIQA